MMKSRATYLWNEVLTLSAITKLMYSKRKVWLILIFLLLTRLNLAGAGVTIPSPQEGERMEADEVAIAIFAEEIELGSLKVTLDNQDITEKLTGEKQFRTYLSEGLPAGKHSLVVTFEDKMGKKQVIQREFIVTGRIQQQDFQLTGSLIADLKFNHLSGPGKELRQEPSMTRIIQLGINGQMTEMEVAGKIFITSDEQSSQQSKNRFKVVLAKDGVNLSLGDNNPAYNTLILDGLRVRGVEVLLGNENFNLNMVHGETARAIEGQSGTNSGTLQKNLTGTNVTLSLLPNLKMGLSEIRAKDKKSSIKFAPKPLENTVVGANVQSELWHQRIRLITEIAVSNLEDPTQASTEDTSDQLAYRLKIATNLFKHQFTASFNHVETGFKSLGNPSLTSDKKGFKVADSFSLFEVMDIALDYEYFHNNLSHNLSSTLKTDIFSTRLGFSVHEKYPEIKLNYQTYQKENGQVKNVSGAIDDQVDSFSLNSIYHLNLFKSSFAQFNYSQTKRKDRVNSSTENKSNQFGVSLNSQFYRPITIELGGKLTNEDFSGGKESAKTKVFLLGINHLFFSNQLGLSFDFDRTSSTGNKIDSNRISFSSGLSWKLTNSQTLEANIGWVDFEDRISTQNNYQEEIFQLNFVQKIR